MSPLWRAETPLVLASRSAARRALLEAAGIPVEVVLPDVDERAAEAAAGVSAGEDVAAALARAKALAGAALRPGRLVLGADQTLVFGPDVLHKARTRDDARKALRSMRGRPHVLHSAAALAQDGAIVWQGAADARLTMRPFDDAFLDRYLDAAGDAVTDSVGGYQLEALGVHLFERIAGDHATILGLPLLPVLEGLRRLGALVG